MNLKTNPVTLYSCMFCHENKFKKLGYVQKTKMVFGICKNCKLTQTYIRWYDEDFAKYYSSGEYLAKLSGAKNPNKWHFDYAIQNRELTVNEIKKHITKKQKILEFGCSVGALVYMLKGYKVLGVDIDESAIKFGQNKKINIEKIDIFKTNEKFDIIYSSHVFEHLNDPHKYIRQLHNLLNKNGKLIIIVPSFLTSQEWGNIPHLVYYQNTTLQNFFVGKNWKILKLNYFNQYSGKFHRIVNFLLTSNYGELILVAQKTEMKNYATIQKSNYHWRIFKMYIYRLLNKIYKFVLRKK